MASESSTPVIVCPRDEAGGVPTGAQATSTASAAGEAARSCVDQRQVKCEPLVARVIVLGCLLQVSVPGAPRAIAHPDACQRLDDDPVVRPLRTQKVSVWPNPWLNSGRDHLPMAGPW
jgi:hypothetical protein